MKPPAAALPLNELQKMKRAELGPARRPYVWSLWSPLWVLLLVPLLFYSDELVGLGLLIGVSLLVLFGWLHPSPFVRWHTLQWVVLTGLFILIAWRTLWTGTIEQFFLQAGLWWLGNLLGLLQANAGRCWVWSVLGGKQRPWALPVAPVAAAAPAAAPPPLPSAIRRAALLRAFRAGDPARRAAAIRALEALGEVEEF